MRKIYTVLAVSKDFGVIDEKTWEGVRLVCHEKTQDNGKTISANTRVFKCESTFETPAVGRICTLYFNERGKVVKAE